MSLNPGVLKVCKLGWDRARGVMGYCWREKRQKPEGRELRKSYVKKCLAFTVWGRGGDYLLFSKCFPEWQHSRTYLSGDKGPGSRAPFPTPPHSINTEHLAGSSTELTLAA